MPTRFYFIRHSLSYKTLADRHGGDGEPLTPQGKADSIAVAAYLFSEGLQKPQLFSSSLAQAKQTAEIISGQLQAPLAIDERLKNIQLGVLSGLSDQEAQKTDPESARKLQAWREGKISVDEVSIPGAETLEEFHSRVLQFIEEKEDLKDSEILVVGTRSVGTMICNILAGSFPLEYKRYLFDVSSITRFDFSHENRPQEIYANKNDFLPSKGIYKDV